MSSEHTEGLLARGRPLLHFQHVESHRLGQRSALADSDNVTLLDDEARGAMGRDHAVTLLKTPVLPDVVEVIPTERDSAFHLGRANDALQDAAIWEATVIFSCLWKALCVW